MKRRDFLIGMAVLGVAAIIPTKILDGEKRKTIYLTIDDGPKDSHGEILENLRGNKATFFMVGRSLDTVNGFNSACRALELGNELGNHSYSHPLFSKINFDEVKTEIERTHELITNVYHMVGKINPCLFRFPYGDLGNELMEPIEEGHEFDKKKKIAEFLKEMRYTSYKWDVDSEDWKYYIEKGGKSLEEIMDNVRKAKDGDIVLVHDLPITAENVIPFYVDSGKYRLATL